MPEESEPPGPSLPTPPAIRIRDLELTPTRPDRASRPRILRIPAVDIPTGEYVGITGPNGAGKSQLLLALAGLRATPPESITFDQSNAKFPSLGIVFQAPDDQIVGSTVERDLAFGLENRAVPTPEIRRRVQGALDWSGLGPMASRPPHLLSDGEKQRLALTSTLVLEPAILLLDEPTSRLDAAGRATFRQAIDHARATAGTTTLHVSHRSEELMGADRILGLREGELVFDGTPAEFLRAEEGDRLGVIWSDLHRFRREMWRNGYDPPDPRHADWSDVSALVTAVETIAARAEGRTDQSVDPGGSP